MFKDLFLPNKLQPRVPHLQLYWAQFTGSGSTGRNLEIGIDPGNFNVSKYKKQFNHKQGSTCTFFPQQKESNNTKEIRYNDPLEALKRIPCSCLSVFFRVLVNRCRHVTKWPSSLDYLGEVSFFVRGGGDFSTCFCSLFKACCASDKHTATLGLSLSFYFDRIRDFSPTMGVRATNRFILLLIAVSLFIFILCLS